MPLAREMTRSREWQALKEELLELQTRAIEELISAKNEPDTAMIRGRIQALREILSWEDDDTSAFYEPNS